MLSDIYLALRHLLTGFSNTQEGNLLKFQFILISIIIHMKKLLDSDWLRTVQFKCNVSINSSGAHPPPGNRGAFAHIVSPGGGAFAILSQPRGWALAYPGATPRHLTQVFSKDG